MVRGKHHVHVRHAQRVLQVPQPVHPRHLRHLRVREPRPVRAGTRAGATPQLLGDRAIRCRPRGSGSTSWGSTRAISGGSLEFTLTYGIRMDMPIFPDTPTANPHRREHLRLGHRVRTRARRPGRRASGFNWNLGATRAPAGARRPRHLRRAHAVRVAVQPVLEHGQRVHPHHADASTPPTGFRSSPDPDNQPTTVRGGAGDQRDQHRRSRLRLPQLIRGNIGYDRSCSAARCRHVSNCCSPRDDQGHRLPEPEPGADGHAARRPAVLRRRVSTTFSDVILLTNTDEGASGASPARWIVRSATAGSPAARTSTAVGRRSTTAARARRAPTGSTTTRDRCRTPCRWRRRTSSRGTASTLAASYQIQIVQLPRRDDVGLLQRPDRPSLCVTFSQDVNNDGGRPNDLLLHPGQRQRRHRHGRHLRPAGGVHRQRRQPARLPRPDRTARRRGRTVDQQHGRLVRGERSDAAVQDGSHGSTCRT